MRELYGIGFGEVEYRDLTDEEDVIEDALESRAMRAASSEPGRRGQSVNLFMVDDIAFGFVAVAGGLPGAPGVYGKESSGITVEFASVDLSRLHLEIYAL